MLQWETCMPTCILVSKRAWHKSIDCAMHLKEVYDARINQKSIRL